MYQLSQQPFHQQNQPKSKSQKNPQKQIPSQLEENILAQGDDNFPLTIDSFKKWDYDQICMPPIVEEINSKENHEITNVEQNKQSHQTITIFVNIQKNNTHRVFEITLQADDNTEDLREVLLKNKIIKEDEQILRIYDDQNTNCLFKNNSINDILITTDTEILLLNIDIQFRSLHRDVSFKIEVEKNIPLDKLWQRFQKKLPKEYQSYERLRDFEVTSNGYFKYINEKPIEELGVQNELYLKFREEAKGGCFPAFAPIKLSNGFVKQISDIKIGDKVLSYDVESQQFTSSYVLGLHQSVVTSITLIKTSEELITTTPNHPFFTENGWKAVQPNLQFNQQELTINDKILNSNNKFVPIISIDNILQKEVKVFNISTSKPNNYLAFDYVVHNMSIIVINTKMGHCLLEIVPEILVFNIKVLIQLRLGIEIEKQELLSNELILDNHKPLSFYLNSGGKGCQQFDLKVLDLKNTQNQCQEQIVNLKLIYNNEEIKFKMPKQCSFQELQNTLSIFNYSLPEEQRMYKPEFLKDQECYFFCEGQFIDETTQQVQILLRDNSQIVSFKRKEQISCLELAYLIQNIEIKSLSQLKTSLVALVDQKRLDYFMDNIIEEIKQSSTTKVIYQQFQLHHLVAIKIYTSNLVYKQLNIDLRTKQFNRWKEYLRCLIEAYQFCSYYNGVAYRGIRDYQNTQIYQTGKNVIWSEISSSSKDMSIAQKFSNVKGMIFELQLISAKDFEELSIFSNEKEVVTPPFSQFTVVNIIQEVNSPILVKLRELPQARSTKIVLWIDDNPENNYKYTKDLDFKISLVFCLSTSDAIDLLNSNKWMVLLNDQNLRVVTDMVRIENGKLNVFAGREFLHSFYTILKCESETLLFCGDVQKAKISCRQLNIIGNYRITNDYNVLENFIRFK